MPQLDTRLDWEAIEATASGQVVVVQVRPAGVIEAAPCDPLADLLNVPVRNLTVPLMLESSILGESIFLVANDHQAATVRARGGIPYAPEEIEILWQLHQALGPEVWPERLRLIHEGKRQLGGTIIPEGA